MVTSGPGPEIVGYNVQAAVEPGHYLIVAHEVTNSGSDRHQLAKMAGQAKEAMATDDLTVLADRGYYDGEQIRACEAAGINPLVPRTETSPAKADGRFSKRDFVYEAQDDSYRCPAGERLTRRFATVENDKTLHVYFTNVCSGCALKASCTTGKERRIRRWEHEAVLDAMAERLKAMPDAMSLRKRTAEHPFGTLKPWMGGGHLKVPTMRSIGGRWPEGRPTSSPKG